MGVTFVRLALAALRRPTGFLMTPSSLTTSSSVKLESIVGIRGTYCVASAGNREFSSDDVRISLWRILGADGGGLGESPDEEQIKQDGRERRSVVLAVPRQCWNVSGMSAWATFDTGEGTYSVSLACTCLHLKH